MNCACQIETEISVRQDGRQQSKKGTCSLHSRAVHLIATTMFYKKTPKKHFQFHGKTFFTAKHFSKDNDKLIQHDILQFHIACAYQI